MYQWLVSSLTHCEDSWSKVHIYGYTIKVSENMASSIKYTMEIMPEKLQIDSSPTSRSCHKQSWQRDNAQAKEAIPASAIAVIMSVRHCRHSPLGSNIHDSVS